MSQYNEPWKVEKNDDDEIFICSQQTCCEETTVSKNLEKSNAVRIVACVNACEGIDNSTLEIPGYSIKAELDSLDNQINGRLKAEQQRDELVKVIKHLKEDFQPGYHDCIDDGLSKCSWCEADDILEKIEADK